MAAVSSDVVLAAQLVEAAVRGVGPGISRQVAAAIAASAIRTAWELARSPSANGPVREPLERKVADEHASTNKIVTDLQGRSAAPPRVFPVSVSPDTAPEFKRRQRGGRTKKPAISPILLSPPSATVASEAFDSEGGSENAAGASDHGTDGPEPRGGKMHALEQSSVMPTVPPFPRYGNKDKILPCASDGTVPDTEPHEDQDFNEYLQRMMAIFEERAMKDHPNLTRKEQLEIAGAKLTEGLPEIVADFARRR